MNKQLNHCFRSKQIFDESCIKNFLFTSEQQKGSKYSANKFILTDHEKANEIANSFGKAHLITFSNKSLLLESIIKFSQNSTDKIPLPNPSEVSKFIRDTKSKKSSGQDQILNTQLKHVSKKALIYLAQSNIWSLLPLFLIPSCECYRYF